jgi:mono/diheme cytochrome c family protein
MKTAGLLVVSCIGAAACGPKQVIPTAPEHPATASPAPAAAAPAAELAAYEKARPVFEKYCAGCHSSAGTLEGKPKALPHFNIDGYPFTGHHAGSIGAEVREVLGATGEAATMPADRPGAVQGAELDAILEWTRAFDEAHR